MTWKPAGAPSAIEDRIRLMLERGDLPADREDRLRQLLAEIDRTRLAVAGLSPT